MVMMIYHGRKAKRIQVVHMGSALVYEPSLDYDLCFWPFAGALAAKLTDVSPFIPRFLAFQIPSKVSENHPFLLNSTLR